MLNAFARLETHELLELKRRSHDLNWATQWAEQIGKSLEEGRGVIEGIQAEEPDPESESASMRMSPLVCEADVIKAHRLQVFGLGDSQGRSAWQAAFEAARDHDDKYTCAQLLYLLAQVISLWQAKVPPEWAKRVTFPGTWTQRNPKKDRSELPFDERIDWIYQAIWCCRKAANIFPRLHFLEAQRPVLELLRRVGSYSDDTHQLVSLSDAIRDGLGDLSEHLDELMEANEMGAQGRSDEQGNSGLEPGNKLVRVIVRSIELLLQRQLASLEGSLKLVQLEAELNRVNKELGSFLEENAHESAFAVKALSELRYAADEIQKWISANDWLEEGIYVTPLEHDNLIKAQKAALGRLTHLIESDPFADSVGGDRVTATSPGQLLA